MNGELLQIFTKFCISCINLFVRSLQFLVTLSECLFCLFALDDGPHAADEQFNLADIRSSVGFVLIPDSDNSDDPIPVKNRNPQMTIEGNMPRRKSSLLRILFLIVIGDHRMTLSDRFPPESG